MKIVDLWVEKILNMEKTLEDVPAKLKDPVEAKLAEKKAERLQNG